MSADRRTKLNDILIFLSGRWGLNFYESKGLDDNGIKKGRRKQQERCVPAYGGPRAGLGGGWQPLPVGMNKSKDDVETL